MAIKTKKGKTLAEYPKLIKVGKTKVRVLNEAEENKVLGKAEVESEPEIKEEVKEEVKTTPSPSGWGKTN